MWAEIADILGQGVNRRREDDQDQQEAHRPESEDMERPGLWVIGSQEFGRDSGARFFPLPISGAAVKAGL
jgi:hypothetical protein